MQKYDSSVAVLSSLEVVSEASVLPVCLDHPCQHHIIQVVLENINGLGINVHTLLLVTALVLPV